VTSLLRRLWAAPLWAQAFAYAVVLLALLPVARAAGTPWTPDEGSYALQVRALQDGDWVFDHEAERFDPEGRYFPIVNSRRGEDGWYVYPQHPAYVLAQRAAVDVAGEDAGLLALPLLGALGTAVAAWLLARELAPEAARPAFWIAGLGPVMVNASIVWAHAPSAALAGFAAFGAVRILRAPTAWWAPALLVAGGAAGTLLRAEGVLYGVALGAAVAGAGVLTRRWPVAGAGIAAVGAAAGAAFAERAWVSSIVGTAPAVLHTRDGFISVGGGSGGGGGGGFAEYLGARVEGAWSVLFAGAYNRFEVGLLALVALLVAAYAGVAWRRRRPGWPREVAVLGVVAAGLHVARFVLEPQQPITGLLVAWPIVALVAVAAPWRSAGWVTRTMGAAVAMFVLAVLMTQYREGGGFEWGGRFLSPAFVILAALAAVGLVRMRPAATRIDRPVALALAGLLLVPTVLGVASVGSHRARYDRLVDEVAGSLDGVVVTHEKVLPRYGWRLVDGRPWLLVPPAEMAAVVAGLRAGGVRAVTAVVRSDVADDVAATYPRARDVTGEEVGAFGWRTLVLSR
jgi:hypothetical protein